MKLYQLVCYVNALNKQTGEYENIHRYFRELYVGANGLSTAYDDYNKRLTLFKQQLSEIDNNKYDNIIGKCELNEPDILTDGTVATWGENVLFSDRVNC